jgi:hypothetical protein
MTPAAALEFADFLSDLIFRSLPRSDQRRWARVYLQGLVITPGKKTIRNIASEYEGPVEQSLQQFISKSPWEWSAVRQDLARYVESRIPQRSQAWVVRPLVIEKAGSHSVGVARQFVTQLGRVANCQQAVGIWLTSPEASFPVEWSLVLPRPWNTDPGLRRRARIPEAAGVHTPEQAALNAVRHMIEKWRLPPRPVVMELQNANELETVAAFHALDIPFVFKVSGSLPITTGHEPRGHLAQGRTRALDLINLCRAQRRPVEWDCPRREQRLVTPLVAQEVLIQSGQPSAVQPSAVPQQAGGGEGGPMLLLGAWSGSGEQPDEFWLSNMSQTSPAHVFRLAKLAERVERDYDDILEPIGIRDFEGRSFRGWHHHTTLVSAAHAVIALGARQALAPVPPPTSAYLYTPDPRPRWVGSDGGRHRA